MFEYAIVCVDDEKFILDIFAEHLDGVLPENCLIRKVDDSSKTLKIMSELVEKNIKIAVVVVDQEMPQVKGSDLLIAIRTRFPETKRIMLTGQATRHDIGKIINHVGVDKLIAKPWDRGELIDIISSLLSEYKNESNKKYSGEDKVSIGIITALPKEYICVRQIMDNTKEIVFKGDGEGNRYLVGEIVAKNGGIHYVALALADMGNNSAMGRTMLLQQHFPNVKSIIMVGIAAGIPNPDNVEEHVRLGDIVVSNKNGVIQYDFINDADGNVEERNPPRPPSPNILQAVRLLEAYKDLGERPWDHWIDHIISNINEANRHKFIRPSDENDILWDYEGKEIIIHPEDRNRKVGYPSVFLGSIASSNSLLRNAKRRDYLRNKFKVKAIEMEASGVADATWGQANAGYFVIRGISDYACSKKNDKWQNYASVVAAAYLRALLESIPVK